MMPVFVRWDKPTALSIPSLRTITLESSYNKSPEKADIG